MVYSYDSSSKKKYMILVFCLAHVHWLMMMCVYYKGVSTPICGVDFSHWAEQSGILILENSCPIWRLSHTNLGCKITIAAFSSYWAY